MTKKDVVNYFHYTVGDEIPQALLNAHDFNSHLVNIDTARGAYNRAVTMLNANPWNYFMVDDDCEEEFSCDLPVDGEKALFLTKWGEVFIDVFHDDGDCIYLENMGGDFDFGCGKIIGWMPIPEDKTKTARISTITTALRLYWKENPDSSFADIVAEVLQSTTFTQNDDSVLDTLKCLMNKEHNRGREFPF